MKEYKLTKEEFFKAREILRKNNIGFKNLYVKISNE